MSFAFAVQGMDASLIKVFGELCTYAPATGEPSTFNAVIEYELSFYSQVTDVASGGVVITCLTADMPKPRHGDKITDSQGKHWKILKPIENDGNVIAVSAVQDHRAPDLT